MTDERLPTVSPILDPVRRLIEMAAENKAKLFATANPVKLDQHELAAAGAAAEIVAADPAIGPVEVIHIGPNADVPDMRYLILLFQGERGFLFDTIAGKTSIVDLEVDPALTTEARLQAKIERAKTEAAKLKLGKVYVVKS
jgi:hypothetical protein